MNSLAGTTLTMNVCLCSTNDIQTAPRMGRLSLRPNSISDLTMFILGLHMSYVRLCFAQQDDHSKLRWATWSWPSSMQLCESTHLERQLVSPLFALSLTLCIAIGELEVGMEIMVDTALWCLQVCIDAPRR